MTFESSWKRLASFVVLCAASIPCLAQPLDRKDYKFSVAQVFSNATRYDGVVESSSGTGFVVSDKGDILTALHVTGDPELYESIELKIYFSSRNSDGSWSDVGPYLARVRATLDAYDLSLLSLQDVSYAATLPALGFTFLSKNFDGGEKLDGYAFNFLDVPGRGEQPAVVQGFVSRTSTVHPFCEIGNFNLNAGGSGGPVLSGDATTSGSGSGVIAVWHGAVVNFKTSAGEVRAVNGTAWVIPMTNDVQAWMTSNGVTPRIGPAERIAAVESPISTRAVVVLGESDLRKAQPANVSSLERFAAAPAGTEIVGARLVTGEISTELPVTSGRVALVDRALPPDSRIELTVQPRTAVADVDIRYVSLAQLNQSGDWGVGVPSVAASPGRTIVAASYVGDPAAKGKSRWASLGGESVVITKPPLLGNLFGKKGVRLPAVATSNAATGQFVVLEAEAGITPNKAVVAAMLEKELATAATASALQPDDGSIVAPLKVEAAIFNAALNQQAADLKLREGVR